MKIAATIWLLACLYLFGFWGGSMHTRNDYLTSRHAEAQPDSTQPADAPECGMWTGEGRIIKSGEDIYVCKFRVVYEWQKVDPQQLKEGYKP